MSKTIDEIREKNRINLINTAISRGFSRKRAEWIVAEFEDIRRILGYPKAYEQFIRRMCS